MMMILTVESFYESLEYECEYDWIQDGFKVLLFEFCKVNVNSSDWQPHTCRV